MSRKLRGPERPKQKGIMSNDLKPLSAAAHNGDIPALAFFVSKYEMKSIIEVTRSINNGWSFLHYAAKRGQADVLKFFIDHGADIHDRDQLGATPLHVAASSGQKEAVAVLLALGARADVADNAGWQPLAAAAFRGHRDAAEILLCQPNVDVNAANHAGLTALHKAVGHPATMKLLIDRGANIDAQDINGWTPLMWAAGGTGIDNQAHSATMLIEHGARIDLASVKGCTALMLAEQGGAVDVAALIAKEEAQRQEQQWKLKGDVTVRRIRFRKAKP